MLDNSKPRYKCIQHILSCNIFKLFAILGLFITRFFRYPITEAREIEYQIVNGFLNQVQKLTGDSGKIQ
jgi:hypothetical protein